MTYKTRKNSGGARKSKNKRLGKRRTFRKKIMGGHDWHNLNIENDNGGEVNNAGFDAFIKKMKMLKDNDFKIKIDEIESGILNCGVNFNEYGQLENNNRICLRYTGHSDKTEKIFREYVKKVYFNDSDKSSNIGVYQKEKKGHVYCFDRPSTFTGVLGRTSTRGTTATEFFRNLQTKAAGNRVENVFASLPSNQGKK